jgi:hypothetical protein
MSRLAFLGMLFSLPLLLLAQGLPDIMVFDEDDLNGTGYYDASWGFYTAPSMQMLAGPTGDKLSITKAQHYTGFDAGVIQWISAPGGNWGIVISSILWQGRDASAYDSIIFYLNAPAALAGNILPKVGLESTTNAKTSTVDLGTYLPTGVDSDTLTWQRISIPLTAFQPYVNFVLTDFKDINFWQNQADNVQHIMWIDNVRIIAKVALTDTTSPKAPVRMVTRVGDQSIVLHWNRNTQINLQGYNIYRAAAKSGAYTKVNTSLSISPGIVDFNVVNNIPYWYYVCTVTAQGESASSDTVMVTAKPFVNDNEFLDYLESTALDYFWYEANPVNGLIRDRSQAASASSIAAIGFGLTAYGVGVDRGWLTHAEAADRTWTTLKTLWNLPQGSGATGIAGYKGWFYHFLDLNSGLRTSDCELSSIDTGLLFAGILYAKEYFTGVDSIETGIRILADSLFNRIDWNWMANGQQSLTMGWYPAAGFLSARWIGYNEAMILNLMGIGANINPLSAQVWNSWTSGYSWRTYYGYSYVWYPALFTHQYSHCWIDFSSKQDSYMANKGIDYAENTRRASFAQWEYCKANPGGWTGYNSNVWGLTACDGPGFGQFSGYNERGCPPSRNDDGTIAPTAAGGSLPFAAEICLPTLKYFYSTYRTQAWTPYGFRDAFNLTANWWDNDVLGIDQGPILLMAENYRTRSVWNTMKNSTVIQQGLQKAGFTTTNGIVDAGHQPEQYALLQNYPNPFNPTTSIEYALPKKTRVKIVIFDMLGRQIRTLVDEGKSAGRYKVEFDARNLSSEVYFYHLQAGSFTETKKLVLLR